MPLENIGNKITSVKVLKNKVVIKLKDESRIELPQEVFTSFYLFKGKVLSEKEIKDIDKQVRIFDLYNYRDEIIALMASSGLSEADIRKGLENNFRDSTDSRFGNIKFL